MSMATSSGCIVRVGTTATVESSSPGIVRCSPPHVLHFDATLDGGDGGSLSRDFRVQAPLRSGRRWRLKAIRELQQQPQQIQGGAGNTAPTNTVEIPVSCYQIIGVPDKAEKDEIVKSVMVLKNAEVEEGYTMETVMSRQELLMDVRDKLLFEPEYAGNVKEKIPPKSSLRIPWAWLPAALGLLQEVGEEKIVLDIGRRALQLPAAKPYMHDFILSMALAECAIAKIGFEKNKVSDGFEALARAQCLLRSKTSLGKMALLSQIEESLEELAPACTLELLGMPYTPENAERRRGAIAALRELLRQGLDVETSCQVQDWPCFLSQAFNRLMAVEITDLLHWDNLAVIRKNKKSLESQNQRVVIDFNCFYMVLIAHIALGFSSKQTDLINEAKKICECLIASDGIDLKFEEAFCSFLLGQGNQAEAVEKLRQLESGSNTAPQNSIPIKEIKDSSSVNPSLELWLKEMVLSVFPDTRDCSPSLASFFGAEKRTRNRQTKGALKTVTSINHRQISNGVASNRRDIEEPLSYKNASQHLGPAVKQLAPADLQSPLILGKSSNDSDINQPSVQLKRQLGAYHNTVWENWLVGRDVVGRVIFVTVLGCVVLMFFKLSAVRFGRMRGTSCLASHKPIGETSALARKADPSLDCRNSITDNLKKLLVTVTKQLRNRSNAGNLQSSRFAANLSSSIAAVYRTPMPMQEAELLVKQWQAAKAQALGPNHQIDSLSEVLDDSMLAQWQALADAARLKSCFWRFVLLQLSVIRADIFSDATGTGIDMAEIEAVLEEAAELVDESQPKNPNYYSTYTVRYILRRQEDGSWKFCEGDIQMPC